MDDTNTKPMANPADDQNTPVVPVVDPNAPVVPVEPVAEVPGEVSNETPAGEEVKTEDAPVTPVV